MRWTLAIEPRLLQRLAAPLAPIVMRRVFQRAMSNLGTHLSGSSPTTSGWVDVDRWMTRLNPAVVWLLRSRLRRLLDGGLMLITVTGRRSGCRFTIPVGYQRHGDRLHVLVSRARRKQWWRNYARPGAIEVDLRGERRRGEARVVDAGSDRFREVVEATLRRLPMLGKQLGIDYDRHRGLTEKQRRTVASEAVLIEITLTGPAGPPAAAQA